MEKGETQGGRKQPSGSRREKQKQFKDIWKQSLLYVLQKDKAV